MGPPPFGDGNTLDAAVLRRLKDASMGPPPFGDGNPPWRGGRGVRPSGFNGATAFRRWKRLSTATIATGQASFNGATAFRRWKPVRRLRPSVWPRGFNGATAFRRWKPAGPATSGLTADTLQWGHRLSAMETWVGHGPRVPRHRGASMGPPPFGDGNSWRARRTSTRTTLQWGHRLSAMETCPSTWRPPCGACASMGPPPFGDGNQATDKGNKKENVASMGPPPFGDGNVKPGKRPSALEGRLQWGHRLSAMETLTSHTALPLRVRRLQWGHRLSAMET